MVAYFGFMTNRIVNMQNRFSSTAASILRLIKMEDYSNPHLQKITELNNATHRIKELDGAKLLLPEADAAISVLQNWKDTRKQENEKLTADQMQEKKQILTSASTKFTIAKYLMLSGHLVNLITISYLFYKHENFSYVDNFWADQACKIPGRIALGFVAHEAEVHLYKAKRGYIQLQQITQGELDSVDQVAEEKSQLEYKKQM